MAAITPKDMEERKEGEYINPKCIRNGAGNEKKVPLYKPPPPSVVYHRGIAATGF
jgi:hypothetical protein